MNALWLLVCNNKIQGMCHCKIGLCLAIMMRSGQNLKLCFQVSNRQEYYQQAVTPSPHLQKANPEINFLNVYSSN
jgi:hypothetical protein